MINMQQTDRFAGVVTVEKKTSTPPEFTFQHWLKNELEVAVVFELATGLSFPRRGSLWTGLHEQLEDIKKMMLSDSEPRTLGHYASEYLRRRIDR